MPYFTLLLCAILLVTLMNLNAVETDAVHKINTPGTYQKLNNDKTPIRIPFTMQNNKPVMEAMINGKPASLTIDNGKLWDEIWLFGTPLSDEIALKNVGESIATIEGAGDGDATEATLAENLTLSFPDIEFYDQVALISPASAGFAHAFKGIDGQICNTFFSHFVVEFDFDQGVIMLHDPHTFCYNGDACVLDIRHESSGTCSLPASFILNDGEVHKGRVDMDLGGVKAVLVALNNKNGISVPEGAKAEKLYGAQGEFTVYESTIKELILGSFTVKNPEASFCDETSGSVHPDNLGTVGLPLLQRFNPIFDYRKNLLYLQSNM